MASPIAEDNENVEASLAGGMNLGERGHIMGSIEYYKANRVEGYEDRDWYQNWGTVDVERPNNQPSVIARDVRSRTVHRRRSHRVCPARRST